jgi:hypothetical protein
MRTEGLQAARSWLWLSGFCSTPIRFMPRAWIMVSTDSSSEVSRLEATMRGMSMPCSCNCWISSMPSMPGISRSITTSPAAA